MILAGEALTVIAKSTYVVITPILYRISVHTTQPGPMSVLSVCPCVIHCGRTFALPVPFSKVFTIFI